ncbi:hypothetical protein SEA_LILBEANIE_90 [Gordonia phage Lilbeanie]|uniref:Uncharacterized protein n=1 Tax=Gordonia phage Lilbeanie TaxID=2794947 RepID=A0A7T1KSE2_9CAUD|nr:hypothetical protein J1773_gp90 [Gordonia phage Lilbeanie]QPO17168.1 hypothetical protein SEA_LILBEANIE_90 [Gordonia phage Lilbeanie]
MSNVRFAATTRDNIWGTLGTSVAGADTAANVFERAGLANWNVRKTPAYFMTDPVITEDGVSPAVPVQVPDKFATIYDDPITGTVKPLGVVGKVWHPIQNEESALLLDTLAGESGADFQVAGSMRDGRDVFVTMQMPDHLRVMTSDGVVDPIGLNIVALNSHDGTSSFRILITPIRLACMNQQRVAKSMAVSSVSIRHTRNAGDAIREVRHALGLVSVYAEHFTATAQDLADTRMSFEESARFFHALTRSNEEGIAPSTKTQREALAHNIWINHRETETLQPELRQTRWGAYQAITEWADHLAPVTRSRGADAATRRATRIAQGGAGEELKERAWELLTV